jgi:hypothetical protein
MTKTRSQCEKFARAELNRFIEFGFDRPNMHEIFADASTLKRSDLRDPHAELLLDEILSLLQEIRQGSQERSEFAFGVGYGLGLNIGLKWCLVLHRLAWPKTGGRKEGRLPRILRETHAANPRDKQSSLVSGAIERYCSTLPKRPTKKQMEQWARTLEKNFTKITKRQP